MWTMMASIAWAQGMPGTGSGTGTLMSLIPFILIFVIFYFLLILPQQRRQKKTRAMLESLKKGDKVVTSAGIWGTVTNLGKETVTLQVADNTKLKVQREHITRLRTEDED
jgi:preprotein translocase subunit YajC